MIPKLIEQSALHFDAKARFALGLTLASIYHTEGVTAFENNARFVGLNTKQIEAVKTELKKHKSQLLEACQQALFAVPTTHGAFETIKSAVAKML